MPTGADIEWPQGTPQFDTGWRAVSEGLAGNGILNPGDLEVTATANNREVQVATGSVMYDGTEYVQSSSSTHTVSTGDGSDPRWDIVYFDTATSSAGTREGTPSATPEPPDLSGDEILLALLKVTASFDAPFTRGDDLFNWRSAGEADRDQLAVTSATTTSGEDTILADTSGGAFTVTLATSDVKAGRSIRVVDSGGAAGSNNITVAAEGGETINGPTGTTIATNYGYREYESDGTAWFEVTSN